MIEQHPEGIRFSDIYKWFRTHHPETSEGTLVAQIATVVQKFPNRVTKVARGLYAPIKATNAIAEVIPPRKSQPVVALREDRIYEPFARYLENELEEVTTAEPFGGAALRTKWGTPDVIGVYRASKADPIQFPLEIVCAEIKAASDQAVVAFGQAISYRLFAHKVYIVIPSAMERDEFDRLQALCLLFGIGLVSYTETSGTIEFDIRSRASRYEPDTYFMNLFAKQLNQFNERLFQRLFP